MAKNPIHDCNKNANESEATGFMANLKAFFTVGKEKDKDLEANANANGNINGSHENKSKTTISCTRGEPDDLRIEEETDRSEYRFDTLRDKLVEKHNERIAYYENRDESVPEDLPPVSLSKDDYDGPHEDYIALDKYTASLADPQHKAIDPAQRIKSPDGIEIRIDHTESLLRSDWVIDSDTQFYQERLPALDVESEDEVLIFSKEDQAKELKLALKQVGEWDESLGQPTSALNIEKDNTIDV